MKKTVIDLNNCIEIDLNVDFEEYLDTIYMEESYTYVLDSYLEIVGYKNSGITDLKIEIIRDGHMEYLYSISSDNLCITSDIISEFIYAGGEISDIISYINHKYSVYFKLPDTSDEYSINEHINIFYDIDGIEEDSDDDDETDNEEEELQMNEYKYEKYIILVADDFRADGKLHNCLTGAEHISTSVYNKMCLYNHSGVGVLKDTGDASDAFVGDVLRVDSSVIDELMKELPSNVCLKKYKLTDVHYFTLDDSAWDDSERCEYVNELNTDDKYKKMEFADWLHPNEYDVLDKFSALTSVVKSTASSTSSSDADGLNVLPYTKEQYDLILSEYKKYKVERLAKKQDVYAENTTEDEQMLMHWFISGDANALRLQLLTA